MWTGSRYVNLNTSEEKLSLYDETKLNEVEDGANCRLYVSTGCFLPKEMAWEVIRYFLETGKASDKIRWISPDDIPEDGNYFWNIIWKVTLNNEIYTLLLSNGWNYY